MAAQAGYKHDSHHVCLFMMTVMYFVNQETGKGGQ